MPTKMIKVMWLYSFVMVITSCNAFMRGLYRARPKLYDGQHRPGCLLMTSIADSIPITSKFKGRLKTQTTKNEEETGSNGDSTRRAFLLGSALIAPILTWPLPTKAFDEEDRRISVFEKTSRSVVFIDTFVERRDSLTTNIMEVPLGSGSGFVWDKLGHIVTNYHVVRNARSAQVAILLSGADAKAAAAKSTSPTAIVSKSDSSFRQTFTASIVGVDPGKDIAVLKIEADPIFLFPISVGSSSGIKVGQQAMAIGNPFGLDHTLTSGIISGTGREVRSPIGRPITNVLQTDAAINPG